MFCNLDHFPLLKVVLRASTRHRKNLTTNSLKMFVTSRQIKKTVTFRSTFDQREKYTRRGFLFFVFFCYARPVYRSSASFRLIDLNSLKKQRDKKRIINLKIFFFLVHVCYYYNVALRDSRVTTLSLLFIVSIIYKPQQKDYNDETN